MEKFAGKRFIVCKQKKPFAVIIKSANRINVFRKSEKIGERFSPFCISKLRKRSERFIYNKIFKKIFHQTFLVSMRQNYQKDFLSAANYFLFLQKEKRN